MEGQRSHEFILGKLEGAWQEKLKAQGFPYKVHVKPISPEGDLEFDINDRTSNANIVHSEKVPDQLLTEGRQKDFEEWLRKVYLKTFNGHGRHLIQLNMHFLSKPKNAGLQLDFEWNDAPPKVVLTREEDGVFSGKTYATVEAMIEEMGSSSWRSKLPDFPPLMSSAERQKGSSPSEEVELAAEKVLLPRTSRTSARGVRPAGEPRTIGSASKTAIDEVVGKAKDTPKHLQPNLLLPAASPGMSMDSDAESTKPIKAPGPPAEVKPVAQGRSTIPEPRGKSTLRRRSKRSRLSEEPISHEGTVAGYWIMQDLDAELDESWDYEWIQSAGSDKFEGRLIEDARGRTDVQVTDGEVRGDTISWSTNGIFCQGKLTKAADGVLRIEGTYGKRTCPSRFMGQRLS